MNQVNNIVKGISEMDSEILSEVLSDDIIYQGALKDVFIEKLNEAFDIFKKENDTNLTAHSGICMSKECDNKGCKGYTFIGNKSNRSIDLIIKEQNNSVKDILQCYDLKTDLGPIPYEKRVFISISSDEKAYFKPTTEYHYQGQLADKAFEEIDNYIDHCFSKEDIVYLVEKYEDLYTDLFSPLYSRFKKFETAFEALREIRKFIGKEVQIFEALDCYDEQEMISDKKLLKWLLQFEDLGLDMYSFDYLMDNAVFEKNDSRTAIFNNRTGFKIYKNEFINEIKFSQLFSEKYWNFIDKYKCQDKIDLIESDLENYLEPRKLKDYVDLTLFGINN